MLVSVSVVLEHFEFILVDVSVYLYVAILWLLLYLLHLRRLVLDFRQDDALSWRRLVFLRILFDDTILPFAVAFSLLGFLFQDLEVHSSVIHLIIKNAFLQKVLQLT